MFVFQARFCNQQPERSLRSEQGAHTPGRIVTPVGPTVVILTRGKHGPPQCCCCFCSDEKLTSFVSGRSLCGTDEPVGLDWTGVCYTKWVSQGWDRFSVSNVSVELNFDCLEWLMKPVRPGTTGMKPAAATAGLTNSITISKGVKLSLVHSWAKVLC